MTEVRSRLQLDTQNEEEAESPGRNDNKRGSAEWINALESSDLIDKRDRDEYKDISLKANWTLSSCKVDGDGFGINELLSDSSDSYWQSDGDGPPPHSVTVEFARKTDICFLALYLDYIGDESYTPNKVTVRLGSSVIHLDDIFYASFNEPEGWQIIDLRRGFYSNRAFTLQLVVTQMHLNGKDTHIRHMRVIGPSRPQLDSVARALVTPMIDRLEFDEDDNGDSTNSDRYLMEAPIMPSFTRKFKSAVGIR